ncbi:UDP-N-acetylmuramate--L-alanine ligase [Eisenibacter elegans]|uniref:UDP-N-acetylmuramate--L-alanine ligase n=1 Tax=Eisenibacter elegans TaxID=997 RepID=UPI0003F70355|nr:UDP-N-acetylmuramate--L-alanine ligase [Eisenibacter elegans]
MSISASATTALPPTNNLYFIGIGGIGMSALARWFLANGARVAGYDKTPTPLTTQLEAEGMDIHYTDDPNRIPDYILADADALIVYTPAIPNDHAELSYLRREGFLIRKRAEVLGLITRQRFTVAIAGTHGKTSTSSMVAHLLRHSGKPVTAFLGGVMKNYQTNMLLAQGCAPEEEIVVVEADEYDRSFLHLSPSVAVILSTEADHLDIYGQTEEVSAAYQAFAACVHPQGSLFHKQGTQLSLAALPDSLQTHCYAREQSESSTHYAANIRVADGMFVFDYQSPTLQLTDIRLQTPGYHNVENAVAALGIGQTLGLSPQELRSGIESFLGVQRRFDYHYKSPDWILIDDYAHHPTEVAAFLTSLKALYPERSVTVIFQPHLFSRTRDFMQEFAQSLAIADRVWLLPIYPAREQPIEGISAEALASIIPSAAVKAHPNISALFESLTQLDQPCIVATVGAGDIVNVIPKINTILQQKTQTSTLES